MSVPELTLRNLGYHYGKSSAWALSDLNARCSSGAIAVLGPNGAGKTTLFRLLTTAMRPSAGSFLIGKLSSTDRADVEQLRARLGYLPQSFRAMGGYSCSEFLSYIAWLRKMPVASVESSNLSALDAVGLRAQRDVKIRKLSGGMRQRLGLAQAIVASPDFLFLDEPTVGLDPEQRVIFMKYLVSISASTSTLMATHLVEDVAAFAREVIVLNQGAIVFVGGVSDLCALAGGRVVDGPSVEAGYLRAIGRTSARDV